MCIYMCIYTAGLLGLVESRALSDERERARESERERLGGAFFARSNPSSLKHVEFHGSPSAFGCCNCCNNGCCSGGCCCNVGCCSACWKSANSWTDHEFLELLKSGGWLIFFIGDSLISIARFASNSTPASHICMYVCMCIRMYVRVYI